MLVFGASSRFPERIRIAMTQTGAEIRTTKDGRHYIIRPIESADRVHLREGIRKLSPESRYRRFHSARQHLSERELDFLTCCDGTNHIALVAALVDSEGQETEGIAVARFYRDGHHPSTGEVAIVVGDWWQGVCVGSAMLQELCRRCVEVQTTHWKASLDADNVPAIRALGKIGPNEGTKPSENRITLTISLA